MTPSPKIDHSPKRGAPGPFQKQHCLFGWFGAGGAEKVLLLARWEYPSQNSLFEVRQAILWAIEQSGAGRAQGELQRAGPIGIRPPLD